MTDWGAAAYTDPRGKAPSVLEVGDDVLVAQRRPSRALPRDRTTFEQLSEERGLLLKQLLVVGQVVTEQRERLDAGPAAEDDFSPTARKGVQSRVALEHPDRVV